MAFCKSKRGLARNLELADSQVKQCTEPQREGQVHRVVVIATGEPAQSGSRVVAGSHGQLLVARLAIIQAAAIDSMVHTHTTYPLAGMGNVAPQL